MSIPDGLTAIASGGAPDGVSRAAIALIALGSDRAAEVMKYLPEELATAVSAQMTRLGQIDPQTMDEVASELVASVAISGTPTGGPEYTREVLEKAVGPERADELMLALIGGRPRPFDFLRKLQPAEIQAVLEGESPQTVALVVSAVRPETAGKIFDLLPTAIQADVARRVATLPAPSKRVLEAIDDGLQEKVKAGQQSGETASSGGVDMLASILSGAGRATERAVLSGLGDADPELAAAVRDRMFTFEDLVKLTDKDLQLALREIDGKDLVLAVRGVDPALMERIVSNMSQRAAESLKEDLEMQPPQPRKVVEDAQTQVVAAVRALEESGALVLPGPTVSSDDGEPVVEDVL